METVLVHPRIRERHPDISEQDVLDAWNACLRAVPRFNRSSNEYVAVGCDAKGRLVEMVAERLGVDTWLVFHALTLPTRKTLLELGMIGR